MRKKYFTLILLGSLLIGCGSNKDNDNKKTSEPDNIKDTLETNLTNSPLENENSVNSNPILSSKSFLICVYPSIPKIVIGMIEKSLAITILLFDINNTKCKSI